MVRVGLAPEAGVRLMVTRLNVIPEASMEVLARAVPSRVRVALVVKVEPLVMIKLPATVHTGLAALVKEEPAVELEKVPG